MLSCLIMRVHVLHGMNFGAYVAGCLNINSTATLVFVSEWHVCELGSVY